MAPPTTTNPNPKPHGQEHKSWKKINEERKTFKRERRQDKLIKEYENAAKLEELAKASAAAAEKEAKKMTPSTVSIAVPGSILENAQSPELRSYLAGQVARAASIFRVNEIIVFDDVGLATARDTKVLYEADVTAEGEEGIQRTVRGSCLQLARILQYLECPQYLRKFFFPLHKDLKYSGILNPLDTPHHLRQQSVFLYREGVVTEKQAKEGRCFVNCGLLNDVLVDKAITSGVRVTVKLSNLNETKKMRGTVVSPDEPRRETGVYWGYNVRIAHSLADIFTKGPYSGGYDRTIGTSDRGSNVDEVPKSSFKYNHLLIVFGGLAGLEAALANEEKLAADDPALLFDHYLNVLPKQGSRTIRTEEALLIALSSLQEKLEPQVPDIEDTEFKDLLPRSEDTGLSVAPKQNNDETRRNNPFERRQFKQNSNDNATEKEDNNEGVYSNPFDGSFHRESGSNPFNKQKVDRNTFNENKNEKKRKFDDNNGKNFKSRTDGETVARNFKSPFKKPFNGHDEKKIKESVETVVDDLEIVPSSVVKTGNQKKIKPDLDLSRFD